MNSPSERSSIMLSSQSEDICPYSVLSCLINIYWNINNQPGVVRSRVQIKGLVSVQSPNISTLSLHVKKYLFHSIPHPLFAEGESVIDRAPSADEGTRSPSLNLTRPVDASFIPVWMAVGAVPFPSSDRIPYRNRCK